jgi:hypothetical protein
MLRSRAASGFGRYGDADAAEARNGQQDAGRHPGASQTNGSHELTPAHQEQGPRHDPPIGSGVASQHADRLPDRAVGGRLDRVGDQPAPGGQDGRQAGRHHCPPRNRVARTRRPRRWARPPAHMPPEDQGASRKLGRVTGTRTSRARACIVPGRGVRGVWARRRGHGALQQSCSATWARCWPTARITATGRGQIGWSPVAAASWRQRASACERHGAGPGRRHGRAAAPLGCRP